MATFASTPDRDRTCNLQLRRLRAGCHFAQENKG
jgi:hypothetical protein